MSFTAVNTSRTTHLTCENNTILAECIVFQYSHLPLTISSGETYRTLKCLMTDIISITQTRKRSAVSHAVASIKRTLLQPHSDIGLITVGLDVKRTWMWTHIVYGCYTVISFPSLLSPAGLGHAVLAPNLDGIWQISLAFPFCSSAMEVGNLPQLIKWPVGCNWLSLYPKQRHPRTRETI